MDDHQYLLLFPQGDKENGYPLERSQGVVRWTCPGLLKVRATALEGSS